MSLTLTSPVTGGAQTGFTSPSLTIAADSAPGTNGNQYAVTAFGGTLPGGTDTSTSVSRPFTVTLERPVNYRILGAVDPVTGQLRNVPKNVYRIRVRKGVTPLAGQASQIAEAVVTISVPAGAEIADAANVRAMMSLLVGALNQGSATFGDTLITGVK
jgi:hypothetical protein